MSLQGTWRVNQKWGNSPSYSFDMEIAADGSVSIDGGFVGTALQLGTLTQVSMGIANFKHHPSVTAYNGNIIGGCMGGEALGIGASGGTVSQGEWVAVLTDILDAPKQAHSVPSAS